MDEVRRMVLQWGDLITVPRRFPEDVVLKYRLVVSTRPCEVYEMENALEKAGLHVKRAAFGKGCGSSLVLNPPPLHQLPKCIKI